MTCIPVIALVSAGTAITPLNFDAGLYHMQVLRFAESSPAVLGLANIHDRFGFNSATVTLAALFRGDILGLDGAFLLSAAIFVLFALYCIESFSRVFGAGAARNTGFVAALFVAVWLVNLNGLLFDWFSLGPNGDVPGAVFCCWAFLAFLTLLELSPEGNAYSLHMLLLFVCASLAVAVKLSQAPVLLLIPLAWYLSRRQAGEGAAPRLRTGITAACAIGATWILQGAASSGCIAYPLAGSCLGVFPWEPAKTAVQATSDAIRAWARAPGMRPEAALSGWAWLDGWTKDMLPNRPIVMPLLLTAAASVVFGGLARLVAAAAQFLKEQNGENAESANRGGDQLAAGRIAGVLVSVIGIAFWFWSAPDPRFGLGMMLSFCAQAAALLAFGATSRAVAPSAARWLGFTLAAVLAIAATAESVELAATGAEAQKLAWRRLPAPPLQEIVGASGLKILIPKEGSQCWNAPDICAPAAPRDLAETSFFGRRAFVVHAAGKTQPAGETAKAGPETAQSLALTLHPSVWGAETTSRGKQTFRVRWLQKETRFQVSAARAGAAEIRMQLATHGGPRNAALRAGDQTIDAGAPIRKVFWEAGAETVAFRVALRQGGNEFTLVSGSECAEISPGRSGCFLLVDPIVAQAVP
jgi:hypothetical protein